MWTAATKEEVQQHGIHKNPVVGVSFTADGNGVASVSTDQSLVVHKVDTNKNFQIKLIHGPKYPTSVAVAADGTVYTVGDDCQLNIYVPADTWQKIPA